MSNRFAIADGVPSLLMNGKTNRISALMTQTPFQEKRAKLTFDSARSGTDLDPHWTHADALSSDSANNPAVRRNLRNRSRYETGSNGYYAGSEKKHVDAVVGIGPSLRMLTRSKAFNQKVEKAWFEWTQKTQLRRKLWCMGHARIQDGEPFGLLVNNDALEGPVQLDLMLLETEQCATPYLPFEKGYIDGIKLDEFGNPVWYDILPEHPGGSTTFLPAEAIKVPAAQVLHWFKLVRPGQHRAGPDMTSTLNVGATNRRMREATVTSVESAASVAALLHSQLSPAGSDEPDPVRPMTEFQLPRRSLLTLPMGWDADQMAAAHPNAQYSEFHRQQLSEMASPIGQPYNVAAGDSSTYSFASGKLDNLLYYRAADVERADCNDLVLDPLFAAWFREWSLSTSETEGFTPLHQWDWPAHPVIDEVAHSNSVNTDLNNGTTTHSQVLSEKGQDFEDYLGIMSQDVFGEVTDENIAKCRKILVLKTTPQPAMQYVAEILGVTLTNPAAGSGSQAPQDVTPRVNAMENTIRNLEEQIHRLGGRPL